MDSALDFLCRSCICMPLNFAASMWWLDRKSNYAELQPSMLNYCQLTVAVLGWVVKSGVIFLCYICLRIYAVALGLVHQYLANCLSFLDVWIQQQKCRRSTWKMMSSCNRQAGCNEAVGGVPTFLALRVNHVSVARRELRLLEWRETCLNPCSSVVDVLWSCLLVAWCVVAGYCHYLLGVYFWAV
jgi:hypothetical protein